MALQVILMVLSVTVISIIAAIRKALPCYNILKAEVDRKQGKKYAEAIGEITEEKWKFLRSAAAARTLFTLIFSVSAAAAAGDFFLNLSPPCSGQGLSFSFLQSFLLS